MVVTEYYTEPAWISRAAVLVILDRLALIVEPAREAALRRMSEFEKAAAIERDQQWVALQPGDLPWSDQRKADALFMACYDRRGLLNELGWRLASTEPSAEP